MISGGYFIHNNKIYSADKFTDPFKPDSFNIYEVVRVEDGIPLFIEDHLTRLNNSLLIAGIKLSLSDYNLRGLISRLIETNKTDNALLRIVFSFDKDSRVELTIFQNSVTFPPSNYYKEGVSCKLQYSERGNPSAKIYNPKVRGKANEMINSFDVYETLLVNSKNRITEGSRSNIFFIKDSTVYTAPNDMVLQGITRLKVINIITSFGILLQLSPVNVDDIKEMDAIFITGTTPKVLPIKQVDEFRFNVNNAIIAQIIQAYDSLIEEYKKNKSTEL